MSNRIDAFFEQARASRQRALMPFLTAGDPDLATTRALLPAVFEAGAGLVEVGVPYSDPIADGPVISASYHRAIARGVTPTGVLEAIRGARLDDASGRLATAPIVTMVSYSIVHRRGVDAYLRDSAAAGVDGLIVPDLPVEEAATLAAKAAALHLKLIQLVTPTTPRERAARIAAASTGFLYYVSVAGITGERRDLPDDLLANVAWLRERTSIPICIGFGVSTAEQVRQLAGVADGVIVGSAIVRRLSAAAELGTSRAEVVADIKQFVKELAGGLE